MDVTAFALLVYMTSPAAAVLGQTPPALTLGRAVDLALRHNARILDAEDHVAEARLKQKEAAAAFRPRFVPRMSGAIGGGDLANQSYGAELSQQFPWGTQLQASIGSTSSRNQLGTFYYTDTTIALTQPILRGTDPYRRDATAATRRIEEALGERAITGEAVAIDVAASYYAIVAQEQVIQVAAKALERHRHMLAVSEAKLEIGKVSQLDVLRARQLAHEAEGQLADAEAGAEDAREELRLLIGIPDMGAFAIHATFPDADTEPVAAALEVARDRSPAVRRAREALAEAAQHVREARGPLLPRVDFTLALTRRETGPTLGASVGTDRFRLAPLVQLSLPVHEGRARRQLAALETARRERAVRSAEAAVDAQVRRAIRVRERMAIQLRDATTAVAFAQEQVAVAKARFEHGLSNNLELVSAEADLLAVESRRISAAAALAIAALRLKATLGSLSVTRDFER